MTHVAIASQNLALERDHRPRAQAITLASNGYDVTLVGPTDDLKLLRELVPSRVRLATYPAPRIATGAAGQVREMAESFVRLGAALTRLARERPIDILHAGNPPDDVWLLARLLRVPNRRTMSFVFDQHDAVPPLLREKFGDTRFFGVADPALRWSEGRSFRAADLVLFTSEEYRLRADALGLRVRRSAVVPNGWRLPNAKPRDWGGGVRWLLAYVGSINEQDNVDQLVRAIAELPSREDVRVVVAGAGSAVATVKHLADELRVGDRFVWLGWLNDRAEVASLIRSADIAVAPEEDSEFNRLSSLVKLGEYMSAGVAVVAHRLPQTVRLAGSAIAYAADTSAHALAMAIEELLSDSKKRELLAAAGLQRFETNLAWDAIGAPALVSAYRSLDATTESE